MCLGGCEFAIHLEFDEDFPSTIYTSALALASVHFRHAFVEPRLGSHGHHKGQVASVASSWAFTLRDQQLDNDHQAICMLDLNPAVHLGAEDVNKQDGYQVPGRYFMQSHSASSLDQEGHRVQGPAILPLDCLSQDEFSAPSFCHLFRWCRFASNPPQDLAVRRGCCSMASCRAAGFRSLLLGCRTRDRSWPSCCRSLGPCQVVVISPPAGTQRVSRVLQLAEIQTSGNQTVATILDCTSTEHQVSMSLVATWAVS